MTMKYALSPTPMSKTCTKFECERCAREARLVEEHRDELLLLGEVRQDALDRDLLLEALEARALGAEHLGHAARRELLDDAVALLLLSHAGSGRAQYRFGPPAPNSTELEGPGRSALASPQKARHKRVHERCTASTMTTRTLTQSTTTTTTRPTSDDFPRTSRRSPGWLPVVGGALLSRGIFGYVRLRRRTPRRAMSTPRPQPTAARRHAQPRSPGSPGRPASGTTARRRASRESSAALRRQATDGRVQPFADKSARHHPRLCVSSRPLGP